MTTSFWNNKKTLVTGHTGFKGSWLSLWLETLGADIHGYALKPPTSPSLYELAAVDGGLHSTIADIRDAAALQQAMSAAQPEIVFHLAAQPLVLESYETPLATIETNVLGTANLLNAVRSVPSVKAVVIVTSDKCYENREWHWPYREDEPMGGSDPYSMSKGAAELVTASFRKSYFSGPDAPGIASARAGNVIGGGDFARDRLITDIMHGIRSGVPVNIRNPDAVRPWQHVLEPLGGYIALAEALAANAVDYAEGWNFGPSEDDAKPVHWICDELVQRWQNGASWQLDGGEYSHEATYLKLDSSKSRARLGWRPKLSLSTALDWIVEWNQAADRNADLRQLTLEQIERFSNA